MKLRNHIQYLFLAAYVFSIRMQILQKICLLLQKFPIFCKYFGPSYNHVFLLEICCRNLADCIISEWLMRRRLENALLRSDTRIVLAKLLLSTKAFVMKFILKLSPFPLSEELVAFDLYILNQMFNLLLCLLLI